MGITWTTLTPRPIAGAAFDLRVEIIDANGVAVDVTGWIFEVWAQNAEDPTDDENWSAFVSVSNPTGGIVDIVVPRTTTKSYGGSEYKVEVWRVDNSNDAVVATGIVPFDRTARPKTD